MLLGDPEPAVQLALRSGRAQTDDQIGTDARHIGLEPGLAGLNLCLVQTLMQAACRSVRGAS